MKTQNSLATKTRLSIQKFDTEGHIDYGVKKNETIDKCGRAERPKPRDASTKRYYDEAQLHAHHTVGQSHHVGNVHRAVAANISGFNDKLFGCIAHNIVGQRHHVGNIH